MTPPLAPLPEMAPTIEEMRRVAHYLSETMGLHLAAGKLMARAHKLEQLVDELMKYKRLEKRMADRENERRADVFDAKLYALQSSAETLAGASRSDVAEKWFAIASALEAIRPKVRAMMNERDRRLTA